MYFKETLVPHIYIELYISKYRKHENLRFFSSFGYLPHKMWKA